MPVITYREALRHALAEELERDPNVVLMGEEVAQFNGAYKVTEGLLAKFGPKRIVDTPISEAGFIGMGIGASMLGLRPVMELMFWSFYSVAFDQILNNAANVRYMSGGQINCPIVIRGPANGGTNVGATHSHTPENVLANHPGVKVVVPATAYDAKGLLKSAIRDNDPVFFLENTMLYGEKGEVPDRGIPHPARQGRREARGHRSHDRHLRPLRAPLARRRRPPGKGARHLRRGRRPPLDPPARHRHGARVRREDAPRADRRGAEAVRQRRLAARLHDPAEAFDELDGPIHRVTTIDAPAIYSPPVEAEQLPNPQRVLKAALETVA